MKLKIDGKLYESELISFHDNKLKVCINKKQYTFIIKELRDSFYKVKQENNNELSLCIRNEGDKITVYNGGDVIKIQNSDDIISKNNSAKTSGDIEIRAPIPGLITKIDKKVGDKVRENEVLCILDAMKMHNEITSPKTGIITKIVANIGQQVEKNSTLLVIKV